LTGLTLTKPISQFSSEVKTFSAAAVSGKDKIG
jgi:hypothetical protein